MFTDNPQIFEWAYSYLSLIHISEVALALQSELSGLQVIAVVPYRGQAERWNDAMKARYDTILIHYIYIFSPSFKKRNMGIDNMQS